MGTRELLPIIAVACLAACQGSARPAQDTAGLARKADSLQRELDATQQYEVLLKRLLVDSNPMRVQSALMCETQHVLRELGPARLEGALAGAEVRAYTAADQERRRMLEAEFRGKVAVMSDSICRQLARDGYLTDSTLTTPSN